MIHLYDLGMSFPNTLCGLNRAWGPTYTAMYGADLDKVNCPDCLGRLEVPTAEPYTEEDAARLRRGFRFSVLFAAPFWAVLIVAVWRLLT